jgi:photosystem II stability/assembly factor-like uncharacterized protein
MIKTFFSLIIFIVLLISFSQIMAQNIWEASSGPQGGDIRAFEYVAPHLYAATGGGIYRSADNGDTWAILNDGLNGYNVTDLQAASDGTLFAGLLTIPNWNIAGGVYRWDPQTNSWINLSVPNQWVKSLGVASSSNLYAATWTAGVYRTTDGGSSWNQIADTLNNIYINSMMLNPNTGDIFVATNGHYLYTAAPTGGSWIIRDASSGLNSAYINDIIHNGSTVFAGTSNGVFRSSDNGVTWTAANNGLTGGVSAMAYTSSGDILAGTYFAGIFISSDNGNSWLPMNNNLPSFRINALFSTLTNYFSSLGYFGVLRSPAGGNNWELKNTGLRNSYINSLDVNTSGDLFAASSGDYVWRSADNGNSWEKIDNGLATNAFNRILVTSNGDLFAAATLSTGTESIYRSTDSGNNWYVASNGITSRNMYSLVQNINGDLYAGGMQGKIFRSSDNGNNWTGLTTGISGSYDVVSLAVNSQSHIFAAVPFGGVYRTTNNGSTWDQINSGLTDTYVYSLFVDGNDNLYAGANVGHLFYSEDNGDNWIDRSISPTGQGGLVYDILASDSGEVHAATLFGIYVSNDFGQNWYSANTGLDISHVRDLTVNSQGYLMAATYGAGVFRSIYTPGALIGVATNLGLPITQGIPVQDIIVIHNPAGGSPGDFLFEEIVSNVIVTIDEVSHSRTADLTFTLEHLGVMDTLILKVGGDGQNFTGTILDDAASTPILNGSAPFSGLFRPSKPLGGFRGLDPYGEWTLTILDDEAGNDGTLNAWSLWVFTDMITGIEETPMVSTDFKLFQNYPNPFNPTTTIEFSMTQSGLVNLVVYNILGERVNVLINEERTAGKHSIQFNANHLASGIYFYRLQAGSFIETKKMILLK